MPNRHVATAGANGCARSYEGGGEDDMLPIGAIFLSIDNTDPALTLGYGEWLRFAQGRVLIGVDDLDPDFDAAGATGGAKAATPAGTVSQPTFTGSTAQSTSSVSAGTPSGSVSTPDITPASAGTPTGDVGAASAGTPAGTVSQPTFSGNALATHTHTFTGSAMAGHAHELPFQKTAGGTGVLGMLAPTIFGTGTSRARESQSAAPTANTTSAAVLLSQSVSAGTPAGTNASVSAGTPSGTVSQPTFTGSAMATHDHTLTMDAMGTHDHACSTPTFSGDTLAGHAHTLTPAGTVSQPSFTGTPHSVMNPFFAVYMFRRTA